LDFPGKWLASDYSNDLQAGCVGVYWKHIDEPLDSSLGKSKEKIPMLLSRKEELAEIRH
jgi:hypothetical protein